MYFDIDGNHAHVCLQVQGRVAYIERPGASGAAGCRAAGPRGDERRKGASSVGATRSVVPLSGSGLLTPLRSVSM